MTKTLPLMITASGDPATFALAKAIDDARLAHEREVEELKEEFQARAAKMREARLEQHRAAWSRLEQHLGLDPETDHELCCDHIQEHQVVFLKVTEPDAESGPGGMGGIGAALAAALGGRLVHNGPNGGIVRVDLDSGD